nr:HAD-IIB family hydrolase [uncultured Desulfuromonas sp.]
MSHDGLLLCTDLDRTLLPNGAPPEHPQARACFRRFCARPDVTLVYVSGRDLLLIEQAIADYALPWPDYAITDVGTRIYRRQHDDWHELAAWPQHIAPSWQGKTHADLHMALSGIDELRLQEVSKQNDFKLSYYVPLTASSEAVLAKVRQRLAPLGVETELIWSIDEVEQVGLLDVLPRTACKRQAIEFLQKQLACAAEQVMFAGDSGNDLAVLISPIRSVLVANADTALKQQARQLADAQGTRDRLYIARKDGFELGGNYAAGILQGVAHFFPHYRNVISALQTPKECP